MSNLGNDLKWSLFVASAQSFKFDSLLRPLPNNFVQENGEIDIGRIRAEIEQLSDLNVSNTSPSQRTLLNHVIETHPIFRPSTLQEALQDVAKDSNIHPLAISKPPDHVFKVCWGETQELRWRNLKGANFSHFGFHGSRLENFYSILVTGLHQHRNKTFFHSVSGASVKAQDIVKVQIQVDITLLSDVNWTSDGNILHFTQTYRKVAGYVTRQNETSLRRTLPVLLGIGSSLLRISFYYFSCLQRISCEIVRRRNYKSFSTEVAHNSLFGQGIYLSSELSLCLMYSPSGLGWTKSRIGPLLSCVAVCEMIDHPDVKCALTEKPSRAQVQDSIGGNVPEKYFVVTNDDMVCVRYLFVYTSKANLVSPSITTLAKGWLWKHKTLLLFVVYICIVMIAGFSGSSGWGSWKRWLRKVSKSYMAIFVQ